ncbi:hypothetical protein SDJN02_02912 [Cucurbita argyrosperma subsp. argyrosperma]|nr:hypothetical protein SDJN02_02912 [Cucurbita argyrosperma subsp. argyrosperma]
MLPTMLFAMTQESTGSAIQSTSTGSSEGLHPLARNTGDSVEKDTCTTRPGLLAEQPGRGTTLFLFVVTVDFGYVSLCFGILIICFCLENLVEDTTSI